MKGWKTIIFNGLVALFGLVKLIAPDAELPSQEEAGVFATNAEALILAGIGIAGIVLRAVTTSPIFKSKEGT